MGVDRDAAPPGVGDAVVPRGPGRTTVLVLGEVLVVVAVVAGLFLVWQLWWANLDVAAAHQEAVTEMSRGFEGPLRPAEDAGPSGEPVVTQAPGYEQSLGIVYIPRFGPEYSRPVVEGTSAEVLDTLGLGHYEGSAMPGQAGNFALAGHRQTNGKVLDLIHTLTDGDRIHVRTAAGYYTYAVETRKIVTPDRAEVLAPDPQNPGTEPTRRLLTLTTCHPRYGDTERYVVHAALVSWRPGEAGPPPEIAESVAADAGRS